MQAYRDALAAAQDRVARSESGENVYTGPDFIGASVDREAIEQIEAILEAQARALGGPVKKGQPYLVGERGPELIMPSQDGMVMTANKTNQLLSAGMEGEVASSSAAPIIINQGGTTVNNSKSSTMPLPIPVSNRNVAWQGTDF
jgi:SLT domain-containing protein